PLAQALGQYPQIFDRLYCAMVAAGEIAGHLGPVLERLADYVEQRQHMKNKIVQALVYPMVLTAVAIGVVAILLTAVVPKVIEQFVHMKQTLPLSTRIPQAITESAKARQRRHQHRRPPLAQSVAGAKQHPGRQRQ
ncbi:type II secretion system F family protein, partial [Serratia ureilytica]|uniref:type II secretion system F family protein n=1 Tax=Serratia ureilytica TaxID=300181 RepID=UPI00254DB2C8